MKCYYCGDECFEIVADGPDMRFKCFGAKKWVLKCMNCWLVQLLPQWTKDELDNLYKEYWQKEDFKGQKRKVKVSRYLPRLLRKGDRVLEVGNGHGDNIKYLRKKGFRVVGVDKDQQMEGEIRSDLYDYQSGEKFDFIYAIHLFEHMDDPEKFIRWMKGNLKEGGRYCLELPSLDDPLLKLKRFQRYYWYPFHLFFYDKKSIRRFFPDAEIKHIQEYGIINHLRWLIFGRPGNFNKHIPILDDIYKFILTKILGVGDTLLVVGSV